VKHRLKMKKQTFSSNIKDAFNICKKNKSLFLLSVCLELFFIVVLAVAHLWILSAAKDSIAKIMSLVQESVGALAQADAVSGVSPDLFKTPELMVEYHILLKYLFILFAVFVVVWVLFKGINWFIARRMFKKIEFKRFLRSFAEYSLLSFFCGFVWFILIMRLISYSTFSFLPLISTGMSRFLLFAGFAVLAYFMFIAYSLIPFSGCKIICRFGVKNWRKLIPAYLVWLVSLFILSYLTVWVIQFSFWAPVFFGLFITLPAVVFGRIYILVVINKLLKRGR